jgi:hypothetical protein
MGGEFNKLIQNIDKLERTSFKSGLSLDRFILRGKAAIKKLIAIQNPEMSAFDIDLIVDSADVLIKKFELEIEGQLKSDAEQKLSQSTRDGSDGNLTNDTGSPDDSLGGDSGSNEGGGDSPPDLSSNSPNTNVTPPGPPPEKFVYQGRIDRGDPVVEVYFKGRWIKTQVFSGVTYTLDQALESMKFQGSSFGFLDSDGVSVEEDPDPPVPDTTPQSGDPVSSNTNGPANPSDESEALRQEREQELEQEKQRRMSPVKENIALLKLVYDKVIEDLQKKCDDIALQIEGAVFILESKLKELVSKLINSLIVAAVAIPAMVIKIVLPPFNIPDALQGLLTLIQLFLDLIAVVKDVVPFLSPLRYLPLITTEENLSFLGVILNPVIEGIFAILAPIKGLEDIIFGLLNKLLEILANTKESNFKKATKKLKKFGHLKKIVLPEIVPVDVVNSITKIFWGTENLGKLYQYDGDPPGNEGERLKLSDGTPVDVYSFSPDDIPEIIGLLDTFVVRNNRVVAYRQKIKHKDKNGNETDVDPENLVRDLFTELENNTVPIQVKDVSEFERFVYDIELPDGTIILGVSEEAIEYYKTKYTLNYLYTE